MIPPMFQTTLALHSLVRWAVLAFGALALVRALAGWLGARPWTSLDDRAGKYFVAGARSAALVGLVLYAGLSPMPRRGLLRHGSRHEGSRCCASTRSSTSMLMLIGVALVHVGRVRTRKAATIRHVTELRPSSSFSGCSRSEPAFRGPAAWSAGRCSRRSSGLYALSQDRPPERGARIARREERADWASVSDEERGEAGCPARPLVLIRGYRPLARL